MTRIHDSDRGDPLREWATVWQNVPVRATSSVDIERFVRTRGRRLRWWVAGELLVGGVALPVLLYIAATTSRSVERGVMLSLAVVTLGAGAFTLWNWRGMLRASAWTTTRYVEFCGSLVHRKRLAWRVAWWVLGAEVSVLAVWIWDRFHPTGRQSLAPRAEALAWIWLGGLTLAAVAVLIQVRRWIARDAITAETLGRAFRIATDPGSGLDSTISQQVDPGAPPSAT